MSLQYLVTSYSGLYGLFGHEQKEQKYTCRQIYPESCFGIAHGLHRTYMFVGLKFHEDRFRPNHSGIIVSFLMKNNELHDWVLEVPNGLDFTVHQITVNASTLYVQETHVQKIKAFDLDEQGHVVISRDYAKERVPYLYHDVSLYHEVLSQYKGYNDEIKLSIWSCNADNHLNNVESINKLLSPRDVGDLEKATHFRYLPSYMETTEYDEPRSNYRHVNAMLPTLDGREMYVLSPWIHRKNIYNSNSTAVPATILTFSLPEFKKIREVVTDIWSIPHDLLHIPKMSNCVYTVTSDCQIEKIDVTTGKRVESPIGFENTKELYKRGLYYDKDRSVFLVGSGNVILEVDGVGNTISSCPIPCQPCCILAYKEARISID